MNSLRFAIAAAAGLVAVGAVWAGSSALPAGNLVKNPGAETPVGGAGQSQPPVYPAAWQPEEGVTDPDGRPARPVQSIRYGPHQAVLAPAVSAAIGAAGASSPAGTRARSPARSRRSTSAARLPTSAQAV